MRTLREIDEERAQVLAQKAELESDSEHIKLKIQDARARVRERGEYADQGWWYRANDALRIKKGEIRKLAQQLSVLKSERSEAGQAVHLSRTSTTSVTVKKEVTAILFKIAKLNSDNLSGEVKDRELRLEVGDLLEELDQLKPDWQRRRTE
jgi:hypothetical protein